MVSTKDFGSFNSGSNPDAAVKEGVMIEKTLLLEMMIKYIEQYGIKALMELALDAITNSSGRI